MFTHIFNIILTTSSCFCYAGYELFQGFDVTDVRDVSSSTTEMLLGSTFNNESETSEFDIHSQKNAATEMLLQDKNTTTTMHTTPILTTKSTLNWSTDSSPNMYNDIEFTSLIPTKFDCLEDERPSNIGPYEIPTQRDLVLFTRNILLEMFNSYNKEAFYLLKDIRAATKATSSIEKKCERSITAYRQCVKRVSTQCQQITKDLAKAMEKQKQEIIEITEGKICNLAEMKTNPITLLKSLTQEKVSLQFALPGFLRLLSECSLHCIQSASANSYYKNKPTRHMTDQDLVIKHFLTRKNYLELIMDSRHRSTLNSN